MTETTAKLIAAEKIARNLFEKIEDTGLIAPGKSEQQINTEIFELAEKDFGIKKYWHKRIVRAGKNTLAPYKENPPDLIIQDDDMVFLDFGPLLEAWEADFGRTYVIGNDSEKHRLKKDIETAWHETKDWYDRQTMLTGAQLFKYVVDKTEAFGWTFGGSIAGHLIGEFPHEKLEPDNFILYVHPENHTDMFLPDSYGNARNWILEMHFVDTEKQFGGFFEQLLT